MRVVRVGKSFAFLFARKFSHPGSYNQSSNAVLTVPTRGQPGNFCSAPGPKGVTFSAASCR